MALELEFCKIDRTTQNWLVRAESQGTLAGREGLQSLYKCVKDEDVCVTNLSNISCDI